MATPTVYVICDQNCKFESMTKEQILTAIMQAVNEGTVSDIDAGFITTIKTTNGLPLRFFYGEQSAYDALTDEEKENLFAIITNDTFKAGVNSAIDSLREDINYLLDNLSNLRNELTDGTFVVKKADNCRVSEHSFDLYGLAPFDKTKAVTEKGLYAVTTKVDNNKVETVMFSIVDLDLGQKKNITWGTVYYRGGTNEGHTEANKHRFSVVKDGSAVSAEILSVFLIARYFPLVTLDNC